MTDYLDQPAGLGEMNIPRSPAETQVVMSASIIYSTTIFIRKTKCQIVVENKLLKYAMAHEQIISKVEVFFLLIMKFAKGDNCYALKASIHMCNNMLNRPTIKTGKIEHAATMDM